MAIAGRLLLDMEDRDTSLPRRGLVKLQAGVARSWGWPGGILVAGGGTGGPQESAVVRWQEEERR